MNKTAVVFKNSIVARYDGVCPYYHEYKEQKTIRGGEDFIAKGDLGWGHAGCVNTKVHFRNAGDPLCRTDVSGAGRLSEDWKNVTCKKCLKKKEKR